MKKWFCAAALICALALTGCNVEEMSSLRDVARPYAAEYKCKKLSLGSEDVLDRFDFVKLNLDYGGEFLLFFRGADGREDEYGGTYEISEENGTVTLTAQSEGAKKSYVFPYRKGKVIVELPLGEKLLYAEFSAVD